MSLILAREVTDIVPQDKMERLSAIYKSKYLVLKKRPQLRKLFVDNGVSNEDFDLVVGIFGGTKFIHDHLNTDISIVQDKLEHLLGMASYEAYTRLPSMTNKELIQLLGLMPKLKPEAPSNQVTNIVFDINEHLKGRL